MDGDAGGSRTDIDIALDYESRRRGDNAEQTAAVDARHILCGESGLDEPQYLLVFEDDRRRQEEVQARGWRDESEWSSSQRSVKEDEGAVALRSILWTLEYKLKGKKRSPIMST